MGTGTPHGEHDWWTPEHPDDGLSWEEPGRTAKRPTPPRRRFPRPGGGTRIALPGGRRARAGLVAGAVVAVALAIVLISGGGSGHLAIGPPLPGLGHRASSEDPFAYAASAERAFESRAAAGNAQVLFTRSPGGAVATAARVAAFRPMIDAAVKDTSIPPAVLEAMVFLESAGRAQVIAGTDPANASGLTQILAETGQSLLGMHINLAASRKLTGQIDTATNPRKLATLIARREAVDDRFNPAKELAATVRYLQIAERHFGRLDLAVESYHMGIGNLTQVLSDYDGGHAVPYAQVYFDSAPDDHTSTYNLLSSFSDDSELYYWRVLGAESIMRMYRGDRSALVRLARLELSFPSNAPVLLSARNPAPFADPAALSAAYASRELLPLPRNARQLGLYYDPAMGSLAKRLKVTRALYAGLRPAALDMLIELVARIQAISGVHKPLTVVNTVADARYEALAGVQDPPALTGYTFQIERRYPAQAVAVAFQSMLDRLQSLNLISWIRGTSTIEITVAPDADSVIAHGVG